MLFCLLIMQWTKKKFFSNLTFIQYWTKNSMSSVGFKPMPTKVKQNGDERIFFLQKNIFSNAIFPHTTHSYTYPTYSKWKILPESFLKSWSQVPACTCSIWNFHLKTAILLHKFPRKWFLCWYLLTLNSNFEHFLG